MAKFSRDNLVWLDLEMTGLDPFTDHILEVATVITDSHLEILCDGPEIVIYHPEEILAGMDEWNTRQHAESGLVEKARQSRLNYREAEQATLEFLCQWVPERVSPMCGNSIGHDRRFLARCMPSLERFFHYRSIDVSTIKELARRWAPDYSESFIKKKTHLALEDIRESIAELKHYTGGFIKKG